MKNREKYKEELLDYAKNNIMMDFFYNYIAPYYNVDDGRRLYLESISALTAIWLDEEYQEPEVDWSKVEVDTPILVSVNEKDWERKHFAEYRDGKVYAFRDGATSWTGSCKTIWPYSKLAEPQE